MKHFYIVHIFKNLPNTSLLVTYYILYFYQPDDDPAWCVAKLIFQV